MKKPSHLLPALLLTPLLLLAAHVPAVALEEGENVLAPIPDDFKPGVEGGGSGMHMSNFVPEKESAADWTQMITVQTYKGMPKYDPDKFAGILGTKWQKSCKGSEVRKLGGGVENGYPFAIWEYGCPMNGKKPENMWMKVIAGNDSLYNVHFSVRLPLTAAAAKHALAYLSYIRVCDTRGTGHPCSDAAAAAAKAAPQAPAAKPAQPTPTQPTSTQPNAAPSAAKPAGQ